MTAPGQPRRPIRLSRREAVAGLAVGAAAAAGGAAAATPPIEGFVDPRFKRVRDVFADNWAQFAEQGASVAATVGGKPVVDLWGGWADAARARPWDKDTIVVVASTTKGVTGLIGNMLIEQGKLDPEALVGRYWPEYAVNGKEETKVKHLFNHTAGVPDVPAGVSPTDWDAMVKGLAAAAPKWKPGTALSYHSLTYGHLVGELIRRTSGESVGTYLRRHIGEPLKVDCWIGTPAELDSRVAEVVLPGQPAQAGAMRNDLAFRRAEIPAGNGHTNARALARLYAVLANGGSKDGVHLVTDETLDEALAEPVSGRWFGMTDEMLAAAKVSSEVFKVRFARGFALSNDFAWMGPNPRAFGSGGSGGSISFADRDAKLSFGYAQNAHIGTSHDRTTRSGRLIQAVYDAL